MYYFIKIKLLFLGLDTVKKEAESNYFREIPFLFTFSLSHVNHNYFTCL